MAQVSAYSTAHGKRYRVRFRTPDGRQTDKRGFRTKREAEAAMNRIEVDKLTGSYAAPSLGLVTVGELAKSWLARKESTIAPSYYHTLASAWKVHVEPRWGTVKLADVDTLGVEAWAASMTKAGHGATTVIRATRCAERHPGRRGEVEAPAAGIQPGSGHRGPAAQDGQAACVPERCRRGAPGRRRRGAPGAGARAGLLRAALG